MTAPTDATLAELAAEVDRTAEAAEAAEVAYLVALSDHALAEGGDLVPLDQVRAQLGIPR